jgi:hypothetical protein
VIPGEPLLRQPDWAVPSANQYRGRGAREREGHGILAHDIDDEKKEGTKPVGLDINFCCLGMLMQGMRFYGRLHLKAMTGHIINKEYSSAL